MKITFYLSVLLVAFQSVAACTMNAKQRPVLNCVCMDIYPEDNSVHLRATESTVYVCTELEPIKLECKANKFTIIIPGKEMLDFLKQCKKQNPDAPITLSTDDSEDRPNYVTADNGYFQMKIHLFVGDYPCCENVDTSLDVIKNKDEEGATNFVIGIPVMKKLVAMAEGHNCEALRIYIPAKIKSGNDVFKCIPFATADKEGFVEYHGIFATMRYE